MQHTCHALYVDAAKQEVPVVQGRPNDDKALQAKQASAYHLQKFHALTLIALTHVTTL